MQADQLIADRHVYSKSGRKQGFYLLILLFTVITYTYGMKTDLFYLNWLAGFFTAFVFIKDVLLNGRIKKSFLYSFLVLSAWQLWSLAMMFYAIDTYRHLQYLGVSLFYLVVSLILARLIFKEEHIADKIFLWACAIWILTNLVVWFLLAFGVIDGRSDFSGIVHNRNTFAIITCLLIGYLIFFHFNYKMEVRRLIVVLFVISVFLIAASASIKGIIGLSIILIVANYEKLNRRHLFNITLLFFFLFLLFFYENQVFNRLERFSMVFTAREELRTGESAYLRWHYIQEGLNVFIEYPLTGVGVSNSLYYLLLPHAPERDTGTYAHNNYIEMLLNGGLPAFLLHYIPLFYLLVYYFRKRSLSRLILYFFAMIVFRLTLDIAWVSYYDWMGLFFISAATLKYFEERFITHEHDQGVINEKNHLRSAYAPKNRANQSTIQPG